MKIDRILTIADEIPWPLWFIMAAGGAAAWYLMKNPKAPGDTRDPGERLADAVWPPSTCAAAMNAGDIAGVAWSCRPATFVDWLVNGKPKGCSVLEDGKISCPAQSSQSVPVTGGGGGFGGEGTTGTW
jgi:hypothetical protein